MLKGYQKTLAMLFFAVLFALGLPRPAGAQVMPPSVGRSPVLVFQDKDASRPLGIESVDVDVVIRGLLAQTTMTMTFRNPHLRVLEGQLLFPLPEGSTVSGYALDVEGQLVEGVVVEKHQARIAFEKEVRDGVDPGLVEWAKGNVFRTRVYPIPASGTRTVRVRYVGELAGNAEQAVYVLPLKFGGAISDFHLKVAVVRSVVKPAVTGGLANFVFDHWEDRYVAEARRKDIELNQDLRVALPKLPAQLVSVELDGPEAVFAIHDTPAVPESPPSSTTPQRVGLYWDASLSRALEGTAQELTLLRSLLSRWGDLVMDVVVFRNRPEPVRTFVIRDGGSGELERFLADLPYDGGTALGSLRFPREVPDEAGKPGHAASYDFHLLFSDGMGNLGRPMPADPAVPVYTVTGGSKADHLLLAHLARSSGGAHLNLTRLIPSEAAARIGTPAFSFLGADFDPQKVTDLYSRRREPVDGRFHLTGKLLVDEATVVLRYGYSGQTLGRVPVTLRRAEASETGLVSRFWAQHKVAELAVFAERYKDELLHLGRRYGLVTPGASLLVLETLDQHLEHDVEPPASRPGLREAWHARKAAIKAQEKEEIQAKLERVIALWKTRDEWWERDFTDWGRRLDEHKSERRVGAPLQSAAVEEEPMPLALASEGIAPPSLEKKAAGKTVDSGVTIVIKPWDPKTPYIATLSAAHARGRAYDAYLDQRAGYGSSPAYYLDCAGWFISQGQREIGLRVLTSILDLDLNNPALLRVVAYRLVEENQLDLAVFVLQEVLALRPEEPQSYRDLALVLARRGADAGRGTSDRVGASSDLERAMALLYQVVMAEWDRFAEIEIIALMELNRLIAVVDRLPREQAALISKPDLDKRLWKLLDVDVRIVLSWDADLTDVDLWVMEPTGEKAFYGNKLTAIGGHVSRDFTRGYGPEEYVLRHLVPGTYSIKANYYGSTQQTLTGPVTAKAVVFTDYGRPTEQRRELTLRLEDVKAVAEVGTVRLEGKDG